MKETLDENNAHFLMKAVENYDSAQKAVPHVLRVLWQLESVLAHGRTYLGAWEDIDQTMRGPDGEVLVAAFGHFCIVGGALLTAASLEATKLIEKHSDAMHLEHLLNLVQSDGRAFVCDNWESIQRQLVLDRHALDALRLQSEPLRRLRNQRLAHIDRRALSATVHDSVAPDVETLRCVFEQVSCILGHYSVFRSLFTYDVTSGVAALLSSSGHEPDSTIGTLGPKDLGGLVTLARLGWDTLPEADPTLWQCRNLHLGLLKSARVIENMRNESSHPSEATSDSVPGAASSTFRG